MRAFDQYVVFALITIFFTVAIATSAASDELSNDVDGQETVSVVQDEILQDLPSEKIATESAHVAGKQDTDRPVNGSKTEEDPNKLDNLFETGVESYLNDDWQGCIDDFHKALNSYKMHKKTVADCRRQCRAEVNDVEPIFPYDIEDMHFFERKVRETLCLMKCKKIVRNKDNDRQLPVHVERKYIERKAYEFLHICYYKTKRYQDAANAIFTFLTIHPTDNQTLRNMQFYIDLPEVVQEDIVDLESDPFQAMYKDGVIAYYEENYPEVIEQLENSLKAYMKAEEDCRLYCEGPFDQGWLPDFTMSIANHFAFGLKCKRSCSYALNKLNGEQRHDLLISHYHYLQYAYFKIGKFKEACAAVESFLLFIPTDETVSRNKRYFMELPEVKEEYFKPRKEAESYFKRQEYELRILLYIQEQFNSAKN
ncbi:prolyl 3-hydroxylase 1 isoform X1 [Neodiprion pinetum]|uniref:prolyl 3-hydroxylase 1 isoform X1 n=2 Tax=Neodiprion pinetum TaxID=441929 RepID=UPI001EDE85A1|nr:prolyl 3-hydroxylase 1-like isoform X1 [Neodiprion pinetum]XP_046482907.1 prolyl 3-hydroxylase 1-like isoform X1 [Neodiprion pinetum]